MSHQPFEDWIVGDEALTLEQRRSLADHLAGCGECTRLSMSLEAVERTLSQAEVAEPSPGFGARFARRLESQRGHVGKGQAWGTFGLALAGVIILAAPVILRLSEERTSLGGLLVQMGIRLYDTWVGLRVAGDFARVAWNNLPLVLPPAGLLVFAAACLGLSVVWISTWYRLAFRRVMEGA